MKVSLLNSAVVIVANQFNPSVLSQPWLEKIGVLSDGDVKQDYVFTPPFAQVLTEKFRFLMVGERFQFVATVSPEYQQALLVERVGKLVRAIPHTPYSALGLNFSYRLTPQHGDIHELTRRLFFVKDSPLHQEFSKPDARFGGYMSMDVIGCRLKLEVKPIIGPDEEEKAVDSVAMEFNFHHPITGDEPAEQIVNALSTWDKARELSGRIVQTVAKKDAP